MKEASKPGLHGVFYNSRWGRWKEVWSLSRRAWDLMPGVLPSAEIVKQESE